MFCPKCKCEYRDGFYECADCNIALVHELQEEETKVPDFKDRKGWLVFFGILQIILGGCCFLVTLSMVLGMIVAGSIDNNASPPMTLSTMIPLILVYVALDVWFIWMGIGSIKAKRWARALILTTSWIWLLTGITGIIFMIFFMPDMSTVMGEPGQVSRNVAFVAKIFLYTFYIIFVFIIPLVLVLFYGSKSVKQTCEFRDTTIRWTDKCPLPVLGLSLVFVFFALFTLLSHFFGSPIPFFGIILTGTLRTIILLVGTILLLFLAWGFYNLNIKAFWTSVVVCILGAISGVVTSFTISPSDFYKHMDFPPQTMEILNASPMPTKLNMGFYTILWFVVIVGYLFYTKKYFSNLSIDKTTINGINQ